MFPEKFFQQMLRMGVIAATDGAVVKNGRILLIKRGITPFKGFWCLPGGIVERGEECEKAVEREVREETGVKAQVRKLVGVYSSPKRDPRAHVVSVCFLLKPVGGREKQTSEASEVKWFPLRAVPKKMGFDHAKMVQDVRRLLRKK
jgi:8-oxo-dGTP diphosphatase